jgi:predicted ArsR family transcriptional regulator
MPIANDRQFFASTRGRIVLLLRRASRTVEELASALELTDNAVRSHLATLERDGLVAQQGVRRGASKPSYTYALAPASERPFPKAYGTVLRQLLEALPERLAPDEVDALLRQVGRRLGAAQGAPPGDLEARLAVAVAVLGDLGGLAELERGDGEFVIRGYSCPLAAAVPGHPEVCRLAESLLAEVVGAPVQECCDRGEPLRCCFTVPMG